MHVDTLETMLWVDRYRPTTLGALSYHEGLTARLEHMAEKADDLPHLLFHGTSGAGKRTRVVALLRAIFGPGVEKLKIESKTFKHEGNGATKVVDMNIVSSNFHIELTPADAGNNDCFIIQDVIKEIAQTHTLGNAGGRRFKIVVLNEADRLSKNAQHALRRTMEKYVSTCRIVLCCESLSKIIDPLRSRCLAIRVAAPTTDQICSVLADVANKEGIQLPEAFARTIAMQSQRNLRRATLALEAARVQSYPFTADQQVTKPDWEQLIDHIAESVHKEQSSQTLVRVRDQFYQLLVNCIPPEVIFKMLMERLADRLDDELKYTLVELAAEYEHRAKKGAKPIFHLEAFTAQFMAKYKAFLLHMFEF